MKYLFFIMLIFVSHQAIAQDCAYTKTQGIEFEFVEKPESLQKYGYQFWSASPTPSSGLPYDQYVGRKGKFLGTTTKTAGGVLKYQNILMEDCQKMFFYMVEAEMNHKNVERNGVRLISGNFSSNWEHSTKIDQITDEKTCTVSPKSSIPFPLIIVRKNGSISGVVAGGDFPGKEIAFRVDKNVAVIGVERIDLQKANTLIAQIHAGGQILLVKSYKWPKGSPELKEFNLEGFNEALDRCTKEVN